VKHWSISCIVSCMVLYSTGSVAAGVIHVPSDQPTIQSGIDTATEGDTVLVAPGTYLENIDFDGKMLVVTSSGGAGATTILASNTSMAVVSFIGGEPKGTEISGFTITGSGACGVFCDGSSPTIKENIITGNTSSRDNDSPGIDLDNTTGVLIKGNVIHSNNANTYGAAIHLEYNNHDDTICYNVMYGNTGVGEIRALGIAYGTLIYNNTISVTVHSGILNQSSGSLDARNNIVFFAPAWAMKGEFVAEYNCTFNNANDYEFPPGAGNIYQPALFADTANHDYQLLPASPCIDAGDPDPQYNDSDGTRNDMGALPADYNYPIPVGLHLSAVDSMHVLNHTPTFYWSFFDTIGMQAAYEIEVGTDVDWVVAEMWASGEVYSADSAVVYAGAPLMDGITYFYRLRVNNGSVWGDWVGNFLRMNSRPTVPGLAWPTTSTPLRREGISLFVDNSFDAELDTLLYDFEVYRNSELTDLAAFDYGVAEQTDRTQSRNLPELSSGVYYWWRARVTDQLEYSDWSMPVSFTMPAGPVFNVPADVPTIQTAIDIATDGDTVLVAPGVYHENLVFSQFSISVIGALGADSTFLEPAVPDSTHIFFGSGDGAGTELAGFTISGSTAKYGLYVNNGCKTLIHDNVFHGYAGSRNLIRSAGDSAYSRIFHNVFWGNGGTACIGLLGLGGAAVDVINNTFDGNSGGIYTFGGMAINNIVTNTQSTAISGFYPVDYNCVWNNNPDYDWGQPVGYSNLSADPMYVDAAAHDYRLLPGSPCVDMGSPDPLLNDPDGSNSDIGTFSYQHTIYPVATTIDFAPELDDNRVGSETPEIMWTYLDTAVTAQTQYHLQIGHDDDWSEAELWDTGPVTSSVTNVLYDGAVLETHHRYFLRIRVHNGLDWGDWRHKSFVVWTWINSLIRVPTDFPNIGAAMFVAQHEDTILLAPGTYSGDENRGFNLVARHITFLSEAGPDSTVIQLDGGCFLTAGSDTLPDVQPLGIPHGAGLATIKEICFENGNPSLKYNGYWVWGSISAHQCLFRQNPMAMLVEYPGAGGAFECRFDSNGTAILLDGFPEFFQASNSVFVGNTMGIVCESVNNFFTDNIFAHNSVGFQSFGWGTVFLHRNVFYANGASVCGSPDMSCNIVYGHPTDYCAAAEQIGLNGNISADPLFCDTTLAITDVYALSPLLPENNSCQENVANVVQGCFDCGDVDGSTGPADIADLVYLVDYMFTGGPAPPDISAANMDGFGTVDIADLVHLVDFMFTGGPPPVCL